jgi:DNA gyrase/topoisomerase IV subunit A
MYEERMIRNLKVKLIITRIKTKFLIQIQINLHGTIIELQQKLMINWIKLKWIAAEKRAPLEVRINHIYSLNKFKFQNEIKQYEDEEEKLKVMLEETFKIEKDIKKAFGY